MAFQRMIILRLSSESGLLRPLALLARLRSSAACKTGSSVACMPTASLEDRCDATRHGLVQRVEH